MQATEKKYIAKFDIPQPVDGQRDEDGYLVYAIDGEAMVWTNAKPIPALGSKVTITMNGIGPAKVVGYFYESVHDGAWVGIMTLPTKPPQWLKEQNAKGIINANHPIWWRLGIGCTYGCEVEI